MLSWTFHFGRLLVTDEISLSVTSLVLLSISSWFTLSQLCVLRKMHHPLTFQPLGLLLFFREVHWALARMRSNYFSLSPLEGCTHSLPPCKAVCRVLGLSSGVRGAPVLGLHIILSVEVHVLVVLSLHLFSACFVISWSSSNLISSVLRMWRDGNKRPVQCPQMQRKPQPLLFSLEVVGWRVLSESRSSCLREGDLEEAQLFFLPLLKWLLTSCIF